MNQLAAKRIYQHNDFLKKVYKSYGLFFKDILKQTGSSYKILYKNKLIYFESLVEDDRLKIFLTTVDNNETCIMVIIDKEYKLAYIESVTNNKDNNCFDTPELLM